ncbi:tetratricopeptide repeat protein [Duganella sp. CT11-25]|uniref:tetratricopeptide repeat protein n=1 Tax=unclassified Duganella TaxID=2636909 RepID=UPI0039AFC3AF
MWRQSRRNEGAMKYAVEIDRAIDSEQLASALTLAEQWIVAAPEDASAWSKLAHVHEMSEDFAKASSAVSVALKISPEYPPYLFKKGYVEYRLGNYTDAARSFGRCVARSEITRDGYYLDAARIAQARCLVLDGRASLAVTVIASAAANSATWLDKRFSKEDVMKSINPPH